MGVELDCFSFRQALRNRSTEQIRVQEKEIRAECNAGFASGWFYVRTATQLARKLTRPVDHG